MGTYGYNPRDKLNHEHTKITNEKDELNIGTAKVTCNIPGYTGFIPKTDFNAKAIEQSMVAQTRQTFIKQNIVENYQVKLPGYQGHKPMGAMNERG